LIEIQQTVLTEVLGLWWLELVAVFSSLLQSNVMVTIAHAVIAIAFFITAWAITKGKNWTRKVVMIMSIVSAHPV